MMWICCRIWLLLQDMVIAAVNEAMRAADAEAANNMSRLTGGLNLGGLF